MNLKSNCIDQFTSFSLFSSLQEFNHHLEMWLSVCKEKFSKGELIGLKRLVRFSAKVPGVCNAKIGTLLKAVHEDYNANGISRSTFKRMVLKAKSLGILTVHETERKNGSQSSNLYIFNRFLQNEPPKAEKMSHHIESNNLIKTIKQKITKRNETELDSTFTSDKVPSPFINVVKYYFPEATIIEEYWKMASIAAYRNNREKDTEQVLAIAIQSFKQLIRKLKLTSAVKKPIAYFYGIVNRKFEELYFEEIHEMGFDGVGNLYEDWFLLKGTTGRSLNEPCSQTFPFSFYQLNTE
ncbi:hypothetical protein ACFSO7_09560 [Bacillus sp. CGMCC 1.16607]|uniref:hypothetical protein n=1 Tax=Bacillus sp. CGMCC 1.16607 TaxID=3351842 RepID=UPI003632852F